MLRIERRGDKVHPCLTPLPPSNQFELALIHATANLSLDQWALVSIPRSHAYDLPTDLTNGPYKKDDQWGFRSAYKRQKEEQNLTRKLSSPLSGLLGLKQVSMLRVPILIRVTRSVLPLFRIFSGQPLWVSPLPLPP
eukprot:g6013.t1